MTISRFICFSVFTALLCYAPFAQAEGWFSKSDQETPELKNYTKEEIKELLNNNGKFKTSSKDKVKKEEAPSYTVEDLSEMTVDGFHLHMSEEDAKAFAAQEGWSEGWRTDVKIGEMESYTHSFKQDNKMLTMYRYGTLEEGAKVFYIEFVRYYDEEQNPEVMAEKLIEKYGAPTKKSVNNKGARLRYMTASRVDMEKRCPPTSRKVQCRGAGGVATVEAEINVSPKQIEVILRDEKTARNVQVAAKKQKKQREDELRRQNSEKEELDF